MDCYDRLQPADMARIAVVATGFIWQAANREAPLPRREDPRQ